MKEHVFEGLDCQRFPSGGGSPLSLLPSNGRLEPLPLPKAVPWFNLFATWKDTCIV